MTVYKLPVYLLLNPDAAVEDFTFCPRVLASTYNLVLHVAVELVDFSRGHQEVPAAPQRLQELLELVLQHLAAPVRLVLAQRLHLALQLHHLPLTHLHLVLQHLSGRGWDTVLLDLLHYRNEFFH